MPVSAFKHPAPVARLISWVLISLLLATPQLAALPVAHLPAGNAPAPSQPLPAYQQLSRLNLRPAEHAGPALLLLFGPDCRFCKQQARQMARLQAQCPAAQLALIGVYADRAGLQQEVRQLQTPLPAYLATPAFLRAIDGVQAVPTSLIVSSDGRLLHKQRGMLSATALSQLTDQLLVPGCLPTLD